MAATPAPPTKPEGSEMQLPARVRTRAYTRALAKPQIKPTDPQPSLRGRRAPGKRQPTPCPLPFAMSRLFYSNASNPEIRRCRRSLKVLHREPNVFQVDDFLTEGELQHLSRVVLDRIASQRLSGSYMDNDLGQPVTSAYRTSKFTWLEKSADSLVAQIERRAADLLGTEALCIEPLQVVSYQQGQQFKLHHDAGTLLERDGGVELVTPLRTATIFVYLNTIPATRSCAGYTHFPRLGLKVQPKRGRAVVFPNLRADGTVEPATIHAALPMTNLAGGRKFGLNIWAGFDGYTSAGAARRRASKRRSQPARKRRKGTASGPLGQELAACRAALQLPDSESDGESN